MLLGLLKDYGEEVVGSGKEWCLRSSSERDSRFKRETVFTKSRKEIRLFSIIDALIRPIRRKGGPSWIEVVVYETKTVFWA